MAKKIETSASKEKKEKKEFIVSIRKLKTNYELRYDFNKMLTEYIKTLPKEHRGVRVDSVIDLDGKEKSEWVRLVREVAMGQVISFLLDNNIGFVFQNVPEDDVNKLRQEYIERQKRLSQILRLKAEQLAISDEPFTFMKKQPYHYQKQAIRFFEINNGISILGDQPGVGKTCSAFAYAAKHKFKTLVVCPASLKLNWRKEILDFTHEKAFIYKFKPKKKSKIVAHKKEESLFHIINYESLESYLKIEYKHACKGKKITPGKGMETCGTEITDLVKKHKECPICKNQNSFKTRIIGYQGFSDDSDHFIDPEEYDLIIIDEFHRIKEKKTGWTQIIKEAFRDVIPRKLLLSGTAIKSRPAEFFMGLNFLDPKTWNNQHEFGVRYCAGFEDHFGWKYDGASNLEELYERMSPVFLRRLKKDVLKDLPPKTYTNIPIELTNEEYKAYNKLLEDCVKIIDGKEVKEGYLEKILKIKLFLSKCKLERVLDFIQDAIDSGEKIVVMSDFQEIAEAIHKHFGDVSVLHTGSMSDVNKQESVDRFQNDKKVRLFCGMVIASGVGITLTAASKLMFMGFAWTPSDMEQAEDRIHRASTTHDNIQIITPYCVDTVDEDIMELLDEKAQIVGKVLDNKAIKKDVKKADDSILKSLFGRMQAK
jgi:SWI/SNF-related matrix-associated actin-dependent regulator of chromatin subfamily A-like protein 1